MSKLIYNEIYKVFQLKKIYIIMLVALAVEILVVLQSKFNGVTSGVSINGQKFPLLLLDNFSYLFVIFVAVFIADSWVDEYRTGTLKLSLLRPVNRIAFLSAKVASFLFCSGFIVGFVLTSAYAIGTLSLGWGENAGIYLLLLTLKSGAVTLLPVLGFGLLISFIAILTDNMVVTIGGTLGIMIFSQMLEASEALRDYSIIYLMRSFYKNLFVQYIQEAVIMNIVVITAYIIIFYVGCVLAFYKKDVIS
ncbi:ABC transporter permease [Clostridium sp. AL.422]|uniref:ABC transporter permease n=1 Tax=Clostridium TaxID=1485 RepID=UPI00293DE0A3|nr:MULTISPECIES: ABC transporter permease [unclassified Clostridium]MDV4151349.1 ABC transporter permease [Clostridium sp. AL.422]